MGNRQQILARQSVALGVPASNRAVLGSHARFQTVSRAMAVKKAVRTCKILRQLDT